MAISVRKAHTPFNKLGPFVVPKQAAGNPSFVLTPPTSFSQGAWTFVSSNDHIISIAGNVATVIRGGTVTISAIQAASAPYPAGHATDIVTVAQIQTDILGPFVVPNKQLCDAPFTVTPPSSGSNGTFTYTSSDPAVLSITSAGVCSINGVGSCVITVNQAATALWTSGTASATVNVTQRVNQVISSFASFNKPVGETFYLTQPRAKGTGAWTYTQSNPAVLELIGNRVRTLSAGGSVITATQAADSCYGEVTTSGVTGTVYSAGAVVGQLIVPDQKLCMPDFPIPEPTSNSDGAWTYVSNNPAVVTVNGAYGHAVIGGIGSITATQAATGQYTGTTRTCTFTVTGKAPVIGAFVIRNSVAGEPEFDIITPFTDSTGAWKFSSLTPAVMVVVGGNKAKPLSPGIATIKAELYADSCFQYASISTTATVGALVQIVGTLFVKPSTVGDPQFRLTAPTSNSPGTWTYTSSNPSVLSVTSDGLVTVGVRGATQITATQAASGPFSQHIVIGTGGVTSGIHYITFTNHAINPNIREIINSRFPPVNYVQSDVLLYPIRVKVTVATGCFVVGLTDGTLSYGSVIEIENHGYMVGPGGIGGEKRIRPQNYQVFGEGNPGGQAIYVTVSTVIIDNTDPNAFIAGGGGGGGGSLVAPYSGGGGGAGGGPGAPGLAASSGTIVGRVYGNPIANKLGFSGAQPNGGKGGYGGGGGGTNGKAGGYGGFGTQLDPGGAGGVNGAITGGEGGGAFTPGNPPSSLTDDAAAGGGGWAAKGGDSGAPGGRGGYAISVWHLHRNGGLNAISFVNNDKSRVYGGVVQVIPQPGNVPPIVLVQP